MSKATKLPDLPLVTSLDSSDTVIATDASGAGKRISKTNLLRTRVVFTNISSPTWVRVAKVLSSAYALMRIYSTWNNVPGNNILVDMQLHPNSTSFNNVTVLSRTSNAANSMLNKIRVVRKSTSEYYIDIYYNATTAEQVYVSLIESLNVTLLTPEQNAEIPEGYTAIEFDITKPAWGGVNRYAPISYKLRQKGGQPDVKSNPPNQLFAQGYSHRHTVRERVLSRSRYMSVSGDLRDDTRPHLKHPSRDKRLRRGKGRSLQYLRDTDHILTQCPDRDNDADIYIKWDGSGFQSVVKDRVVIDNLTYRKEVVVA